MDLETTEQTTSNEAVSPVANQESPSVSELQEASQPTEAAEYTPNLKFKVMGEEKDFDDFLAPAIKDPETEKKVRELYERSYGLDVVKQDREDLKSRHSELSTAYEDITSRLTKASEAMHKEDFDTLSETLGIPEKFVLKWAHSLLVRNEMPEEQKTLHARNREYQKELEQLRAEKERLAESHSQFQVQQRSAELEAALSKPDVASLVKQYDTSIGNAGAFRDAVINYGAAMFDRGYDVPADEAVEAIVKQLRAINPGFGVAAPKPNIATPSTKATIPTFKGSGSSPIKQRPKSIDDIRKLAKTFSEEL